MGQVLQNQNGLAFTDEPFFNSEFIQQNNIASISGQYTFKRPSEPIHSTNFYYVYKFDKRGQLIEKYETREDDGTKDTTHHYYEYDGKGNLEIHKKGLSSNVFTTEYVRNEKGQIDSVLNYKEELDKNGTVINSILLNQETMRYEDYDLQKKKITFNSYGLPYAEEFSYYNEEGYLLEIEERLKMTSRLKREVFNYNDHGWIESIKYFEGLSKEPYEEWRFEYDDYGNLMQKHIYKKDVFVTDIQIIYNSKTNLMTAVLTRDVKSGFIAIVRFQDYQFFTDERLLQR